MITTTSRALQHCRAELFEAPTQVKVLQDFMAWFIKDTSRALLATTLQAEDDGRVILTVFYEPLE